MLLDPRKHYKPFEYPEVLQFIEMMNRTYWVHSEVNFDSDLQEFRTKLQPHEQECIVRSLKAISQIEVAVKSFWGNLFKYIPKPEFNGLGSTLAESEWRHSEAYSRLLDVVGINDYKGFIELPIIKNRIEYLDKVNGRDMDSPEDLCISLAIFTIAVENASLFSQFATVLSFQKFKGIMKNMGDQIGWTSKDENVHANAGEWIINTLMKEYRINPSYIYGEIYDVILACAKAEDDIIDFIFEQGELEFLPKNDLKTFFRYRIDQSLDRIGAQKIFKINENPLVWFDELVFGPIQKDFFVGRPSDYSKHDLAFSESDLF